MLGRRTAKVAIDIQRPSVFFFLDLGDDAHSLQKGPTDARGSTSQQRGARCEQKSTAHRAHSDSGEQSLLDCLGCDKFGLALEETMKARAATEISHTWLGLEDLRVPFLWRSVTKLNKDCFQVCRLANFVCDSKRIFA